MTLKLTKREAARFLLLRQGLIGPPSYEGKAGALRFIRDVNCIQFDPVDICGRNAELVLQARVRGFNKNMLDELLYADRALVDYWDKCMAIFPVEDWPFFARMREEFAKRAEDHPAVVSSYGQVRSCVMEKGPTCSTGVVLNEKLRWPWGMVDAGKAALESLFFQGELAVARREGARKYYDLAARLIPEEYLNAHDPNPSHDDYLDWHVLRRIAGVGMLWDLASDTYLYIQGLDGAKRKKAIARLVSKGALIEVELEGVLRPLYLPRVLTPYLELACGKAELEPRMEFIAPLDNLIWNRDLVEAVFGFKYRWEIYTPRVKMQYGHYVLPLLYAEEFIGRVELVRQAKGKTLEVRGIWMEEGKAAKKAALEDCIERFAAFNGCESAIVLA